MESEESEEHFKDVDSAAGSDNEKMVEEKPKTKKAEKKTKAERFEKQTNGESDQGVIYVGHLPYGLEEVALKKYFSQYGTVQNVHVARSKKVLLSLRDMYLNFCYIRLPEAKVLPLSNSKTEKLLRSPLKI